MILYAQVMSVPSTVVHRGSLVPCIWGVLGGCMPGFHCIMLFNDSLIVQRIFSKGAFAAGLGHRSDLHLATEVLWSAGGRI